MTTHEFESDVEKGLKSLVTVVSIDPENGSTILNIVKTLTVGRFPNASTSIVANRTWRRAVRGTEDPVWFMQAADGTWHPVIDRDLVDEEVRLTWIRHVVPIKKGDKSRLKLKKTYVDTTNYSQWRDKLRAAQQQVN